jgi:hypothetical protein
MPEPQPLGFHPAADLFPLLQGEEYEAFRDNVARQGLLEPIWLCEGQILDGRNRWRACQDLGIEPAFRQYHGDDPWAFVVSMNLRRRQLTRAQRADAVLKLRQQGWSVRQIAVQLGEPRSTVHRDLAGVPPGTPGQPITIVGRDGKRYRAKRQTGPGGAQAALLTLPERTGRPLPGTPEHEDWARWLRVAEVNLRRLVATLATASPAQEAACNAIEHLEQLRQRLTSTWWAESVLKKGSDPLEFSGGLTPFSTRSEAAGEPCADLGAQCACSGRLHDD